MTKAAAENVERAPRTVSSRKIGKKLSQATVEALVADYQSGLRHAEIARKYNVDQSTVTKYLEAAGVARRSLSMSPAEIAEARRLHANGLTTKRIAVQLGYAWHTINNALKD